MTLDIAPRAIVKILVAVVLVWLWLSLWQLLMLIVVSVVLAIALDPFVDWLCRRGSACDRLAGDRHDPRGGRGLFFIESGSELAGPGKTLWESALRGRTGGTPTRARGDSNAIRAAGKSHTGCVPGGQLPAEHRSAAHHALVVAALALVLTIYVLIEGRVAYEWLVAYVPKQHRDQADVTAREARSRILGYVTGNVVTSAFAVVFVFVSLTLLKVPAALLLAVLAGVFDFVPVLGFICSSVPAVILALTVSPLVALIVAGLTSAIT